MTSQGIYPKIPMSWISLSKLIWVTFLSIGVYWFSLFYIYIFILNSPFLYLNQLGVLKMKYMQYVCMSIESRNMNNLYEGDIIRHVSVCIHYFFFYCTLYINQLNQYHRDINAFLNWFFMKLLVKKAHSAYVYELWFSVPEFFILKCM